MSISASIVEKLKSVDLEVDPYKRGPAGKDNFAITLNGSNIRMWQGKADVTVRTNRRKRQALINVVERPRLVKTSSIVRVYGYRKDMPKTLAAAIKIVKDHQSSDVIRNCASINVPNSRMRVTGFKATKQDLAPTIFSFNVEFRTRTTETSFLVGYDESSSNRPFICQLESFVDSFEEAYQDLLPVGVRLMPGHKRQGEWFLNPVSQKLNGELCANVHKARGSYPLDGRHEYWRRDVTTHRGFVLKHGRKLYALGTVKDTRIGRHSDVILTSWHEVIRNNEVIPVSKTWD